MVAEAKTSNEQLEQLNETGTRKGGDRRTEEKEVKVERRKVQRRRQIDPTTCERDYNNEEIEFMQALDAYKRRSGRMFPTCSEILEVIRDLGYSKGDEFEEVLADSDEAVLDEMSDIDSDQGLDEESELFSEV